MKARELAKQILALPTDDQELPIHFLDHDFGHIEIDAIEKTDGDLVVYGNYD